MRLLRLLDDAEMVLIDVSNAIFEIAGKKGEYVLHDTSSNHRVEYSCWEEYCERNCEEAPPGNKGYVLGVIHIGCDHDSRIEEGGWLTDPDVGEEYFCLSGQECEHPDLLTERERKGWKEDREAERKREAERREEEEKEAEKRRATRALHGGHPLDEPPRRRDHLKNPDQ